MQSEGDKRTELVRSRLGSGHTPADVAADLDLPLVDDAVVHDPTVWWADDGDGSCPYDASDGVTDGEGAAREYLASGAWREPESTVWVTIYTWREALAVDDGEISLIRVDEYRSKLAIHPEPPKCEGGEHEWSAPHALLGGLQENPGVWGHGGGVRETVVCRHCGVYRERDTWATDPADGEQGLESIRYREADSRSEAWAERSRVEAVADRLGVRVYDDGSIDKYSEWGSYPLVYVTTRGVPLCASCARDRMGEHGPHDPVDRVGSVEGCELHCDECGEPIGIGGERE